jgi:protein ImuB
MLWACLQFPLLPLEALTRSSADEAPQAIAEGAARPRILALNAGAHRAGVRKGMDVSAALAVAPALTVHVRNPSLEAQALQEIVQWALQFAPAPSLESADSILLEIGGGLKLFGGVTAIMQAIRQGLPGLGFSARLAVAPTPTAASMLARAHRMDVVTDAANLAHELASLPSAAIGCSEQTLQTLADIGAHTVGAVLALPRDALARRFGRELLDILDRALGRQPDPRLPVAMPEQFSTRLELPAPAWEVEALLFGCKRLIAALGGWLRGRGLGVMRLHLELVHEDEAPSAITLALSTPSRDPAHLTALMRDRLERTRLPDRVEAMRLTSEQCELLVARDLNLFPGMAPGEDTELIERLCARLGDEAVCALRPHADHRPELAWRAQRPARSTGALLPPGPRPLWLLTEPKPLDVFLTKARGPVVLTDGPEKIESGWWEARDVCRDYFVARTQCGQTLWLFRAENPGTATGDYPQSSRKGEILWQVHGIFA